MTNIRRQKNKNKPYVQLFRENFQIPTLSLEAKGLWAYLMSLPEDWRINVAHLSKTFGNPSCGKFRSGTKRILRILQELKDHNLCIFEQERINGKWGVGDYVVFDDEIEFKKYLPQGPQGFPAEGSPYKEKRLLINKEKSSPKSKIPDDPLSFSDEVEDLLDYFLGNLQDHPSGEKIKPPTPKATFKWKKQLDLMIRIDKRSVKEVEEMMDYIQQDNFWCQNVLSIPTLRAKWTRISIQKKMKISNPKKEDRPKIHKEIAKKILQNLNENKKNLDEDVKNSIKYSIHTNEVVVGMVGCPMTDKAISYEDPEFIPQIRSYLSRHNLQNCLT